MKRIDGNEPPPSPTGGAGSTLGRVPDLGLSDDVFAGPTVTGADDLHAALAYTSEDATDAPEDAADAPEAQEDGGEDASAEADQPEAGTAEEAPTPDVAESDDAPAADTETDED